MSDPPPKAVFTLRDLNRQPGKVLEAARKFGIAVIRTRGGEEFSLAKVEQPRKGKGNDFPDFPARWKKLRQLGLVPPPPSENERIDRIVAGEQ